MPKQKPMMAQHKLPESPAATMMPLSPTRVVATTGPAALPHTHFQTREELLAHLHEFSLAQGYAVVIYKSNIPRGQVWLRCDLGGTRRSPVMPAEAKRKRKISSRLQNCPFQLYGRRLPDGSWVLKVQHDQHNHDVATDKLELETHPTARRLSVPQKQIVLELTSLGVRPAMIIDRLKERFPDKPIKVQDIYNARNYIRREKAAGRVPFPEIHNVVVAPGSDVHVVSGLDALVRTQPASVGIKGRDRAETEREDELKRVIRSMADTASKWSTDRRDAFAKDLQCLFDTFSQSDDNNGKTKDHSSNTEPVGAEKEAGSDEDLSGSSLGHLPVMASDNAGISTPTSPPLTDA